MKRGEMIMKNEHGIHFAKTKRGVKQWQGYYHNLGYNAKVEKADQSIHHVDGTNFVIRKGKKR